MRTPGLLGSLAALCALCARHGLADFNDVTNGAFGDGATWGQAEPWDPPADTYTINAHTVTVDETVANTVPINSAIVLESGGTLRWVTNASTVAQVINGTVTFNGGMLLCPRLDINFYGLRGTVNVNSNAFLALGSSGGSSLKLQFGTPSPRLDVAGPGNIIVDAAGVGNPLVTYYESTNSTWTGDFIIRKGSLSIYYLRSSVLSNDVVVYTNAAFNDNQPVAPIACRISGNGAYAFFSNAGTPRTNSVLSSGVLAPSSPETGGPVGRLTIGNTGGTPTPGLLTFKAGSIYELDVTTNGNDLISGNGYGAGTSKWMRLAVEAGAVLRPSLYTPSSNTSIDRIIMTASNGIVGAYTAFTNVPKGWGNLATYMVTNAGAATELHFTADYVKPAVGVMLHVR